MNKHPYHNYIFFVVKTDFYQLPQKEQGSIKKEFTDLIENQKDLKIVSYATLGFKANTNFMLWIRSPKPELMQDFVQILLHTKFGNYLTITYTFFGIERPSQYSGRIGKPEQIMQTYDDRLPYFILYPFTKTPEWHLLPFEDRKKLMGEHIKIGVQYKDIRQCLLYSYGVDDNEFIVSYETENLERFQDLVMELRPTSVRKYTQNDTPIFTCIYRPLEKLIKHL